MPNMYDLTKYLIVAAMIGGGIILFGQMTGADKSDVMVTVNVPSLSSEATKGQQLFNDNCIACHGKNAAGSSNGPPLIHKIYEPNHHGDGAFQMAVLRGSRTHHWKFGSMPPQPQVKQNDVVSIIHYVRELQRANGIY